jgi:hypothetical protein
MVFQCSLDRPQHVSDAGETAVSEAELDSYDVLIIYGCRLLAGTDAKFHLGGFGSDDC